MVDLWTIIIIFILLVSNYISFGYGVRTGKSMQKDIPETPLVESVKKAANGIIRLSRDIKNKSYIQKRADRKEFNMFD